MLMSLHIFLFYYFFTLPCLYYSQLKRRALQVCHIPCSGRSSVKVIFCVLDYSYMVHIKISAKLFYIL